MVLRILLVSLVAGMGLDLPSGQELSSWTRVGRDWAGARMVELSSLRSEAEQAFRGATDCERADEIAGPTAIAETGAPTADLAFDVVVEGMASTFAADLAAIEADRPEPTLAPDSTTEQSRGEEPPILSVTDPEPESASFDAPVETRPVEVTEGPTTNSRLERLSAAVRLTRQAVSAWVLLIEGPSEKLTESH